MYSSMLSKSIRSTLGSSGMRYGARRLASQSSSSGESFSNKFNFNINPPPIHTYWYVRNSFVFFAFVPVYLLSAYFFKNIGSELDAYEGLIDYSNSDNSPLKTNKFGESQLSQK